MKSKILEILQKDMVTALKAKETFKLGIIRLMIAELKNESKVKGKQRSEEDVISAYLKKIQKAVELYPIDKREDLLKEIDIIKEYAPKMMDRIEIVEFIKSDIIGEVTIGKVMKELKGKVDGRLVKEIVSNWR